MTPPPKSTGPSPGGRTVVSVMSEHQSPTGEQSSPLYGEEPLAPATQARLRRMVHDLGMRGAAAKAGIAVGTLTRALAGLPLKAGTRALLLIHLGKEGNA